MENKPSFVLYVEERKVFLNHLGKAMRKDKKGGVAVCKIICHHLFSAGCYTCEAKTVSPTEKGSEGGGEVLFTMNGEPLLLCGALRNIDNLCFLA